MSVPLAFGPMPAREALAKIDALIGGRPHPGDLIMRGFLLVMLGQVAEGWAVAAPAAERFGELGFDAGATAWLGEFSMVAGDHEAAERYLRRACDELEASGDRSVLSTYAPRLGQVLCALGRHDEAEPLAREAVEYALRSDSPMWRGEALSNLSEVLEVAGRRDEAADALSQALVEYESKPIVPLADRV